MNFLFAALTGLIAYWNFDNALDPSNPVAVLSWIAGWFCIFVAISCIVRGLDDF